jgi:hypothetical protein
MRRALLALLLLISATPLTAAGEAFTAIDACVKKLDAGLDVGYRRIAERCPELPAVLKDSSFAAWLPHDWDRPNNQLSARGLMDLIVLVAREERRTPGDSELSVARVPSILAAIQQADRPRSLWQRFKDWLSRLLRLPSQPHGPSWWQRLLSGVQIPELLWRVITGAALAGVIALAGAIVINELRVAGLLRPPRAAAHAPLVPPPRRATLADIAQASRAQQPRLLLELLAARLAEQARLPPPRALTLRELASAARLADPRDRERLKDLAAACERLRYSAREVEPSVLERALQAGRELLSSLDAAAPPLGA